MQPPPPDGGALTATQQLLARARQSLAYGGVFAVVEDVLRHRRGAFPQFAERGAGCRIWDSVGQPFVDWFLGWGPMMLGHRHAEVDAAVAEQLARGTNLSLMSPLEVEVAERLIAMIPCAERVAFAKNGTDATTMAVRIARAATGRDGVLVCGYHGFADWYQAINPHARGVPAVLRSEIARFPFNDLDAAQDLLARHGSRCAAVILEPTHDVLPAPGFLDGLRRLTERNGSLLIFDEVVTGFRVARGGAQELFGVVPDLACFGKALANGLPLSVCVGRAEWMRHYPSIGFGLTFRGECLSLAAARACLDIFVRDGVCERLAALGTAMRDAFDGIVARLGMDWRLSGHPSRMNFHVRGGGRISGAGAQAVFLQECLKNGVLTNGVLMACVPHDQQSLATTVLALERGLQAVAHVVSVQKLEEVLEYPPAPHFYTA